MNMMKQQPHKTVKNHERKVIQGIGRKFLASSLCALLSVSNGLNWPVLATEAETDPEVVEQQPMEDETEIVSEEENPTVGNEQGLCVHHPWHDAQCGTDPCQYRCVACRRISRKSSPSSPRKAPKKIRCKRSTRV